MSSPLFHNQQVPLSNMLGQFRQLQKNPMGIADMLIQNNRINQEQYDAIKGMNNPSQIGQYLMKNGVLPQNGLTQLQGILPRFNQLLGQK